MVELLVKRVYYLIEKVNVTLRQKLKFRFTVSIGVAFKQKDETSTDLFNQADLALHQSKNKWGNSHNYFAENLRLAIHNTIDMHDIIGQLLENTDNLFVHYQPIVDINQPQQKKCEALLRVDDGYGNLYLPQNLIANAEDYGLIAELSYRIIEKVFAQYLQWKYSGFDIQISINLSGLDLIHLNKVAAILKLARTYHVLPEDIVFEITEGQVSVQTAVALEWCNKLKAHGFKFAIDDFGKGFSSLDILKKFEFDYVKIDGSFIRDMMLSVQDYIMVKAIVEISNLYDMQNIAEYVINEAVAQSLKSMGVNLQQGEYYSLALKPEELVEFYKNLHKP